MAEVLVIGKKISEMGLVNEITGEEKIPTSALGDKAVTTGQLLTYVNNNGVAQWGRIGGDITDQVDLQNQFTQERDTLKSYTQEQVSQQQVALQEYIDTTNEGFEYILENGAALPYDETIEYAEGAPVLKDGVIQYKVGGEFKSRDSVTVPTYASAVDGVSPVTGVADGAYFNVRSSNDESYVDEYQNVSGSAVATGKRSLSALGVQLQEKAASTIRDAGGKDQQEINDNQKEINKKLDRFIFVSDFKHVDDPDDYDSIIRAKAVASQLGYTLRFSKGIYSIGTNELVISEAGLRIECDNGVEIRGNGNPDGGFIVSFARSGGTAQPSAGHPANISVKGLRVRAVAPFQTTQTGRAACRVSVSYSYFEDCSFTTSADNGGGGLVLEADNTGSGPYYNTFVDCNLQGPQNGQATGNGIDMTQRVGTTFETRYANTNTFIGGRVGGYLNNVVLCGSGNRFIGVASENYPSFGTAFKWKHTVANSNVANTVISPYVENAGTAFLVEGGVLMPEVSGNPYFTGVPTLINDPSNTLRYLGYDGIRALRLPKTNASGLFLGNTNNTDPNTLDWYEEGTWTPTVRGATTTGEYTVNTNSTAKFTRVGNIVTCHAAISIAASVAGSGACIFGGLPYPKSNNTVITGSVVLTNVTIDSTAVYVAPRHNTLGISSEFTLVDVKTGTAPANKQVSEILTGAQVVVTLTYTAA